MDASEALYQVLSGNAALKTALTDTNGKLCLWPNHAPQDGSTPYAVYYQTGGAPVKTLDGGFAGLSDYHCTVEVSSRVSYAEARATAFAITGTPAVPNLLNFKGQVGGGLMTVQASFLDDLVDHYTPPQHDDDLGIHTVFLDLHFWYISNS